MPKRLHGRSIVWLTTQFVSGAGHWGRDNPSAASRGGMAASKGPRGCTHRAFRIQLRPIVGPPKEEFAVLFLCQPLALASGCLERWPRLHRGDDDERRERRSSHSPILCAIVGWPIWKKNMLARMLPAVMVAVVAISFSDGAFAADGGRPRHAPAAWSRTANPGKAGLPSTGWRQRTIRALAADPYADPAAPYKANRLSSRPGQPIINIPSQTTVLTRQVLDDKNATTVGGALRTTPGVTVGR
jgi:hypothetical protein